MEWKSKSNGLAREPIDWARKPIQFERRSIDLDKKSIEKLQKWYTTETSGESKLNGNINFRFGEIDFKIQIIEFEKNKKITWECITTVSGCNFLVEEKTIKLGLQVLLN